MKTEAEIETILRNAPTPKTAPQLADSLRRQVELPGGKDNSAARVFDSLRHRWLPALAYAILILGCVVVLAVQDAHKTTLVRQNDELRKEIATARVTGDARLANASAAIRDRQEIDQLRQDAGEADALEKRLAELRAQIASLNEQVTNMESRLAIVPKQGKVIAPYDFFGSKNSAFSKMREKASAIACINNLKQIGLAFRIYAENHDGWFPPTLNALSNELYTPKTLCCPDDKASVEFANSLFGNLNGDSAEVVAQQKAEAWAKWPINGGSYEVLTAGVRENSVARDKILVRCRIHGNYVLVDGSAHMATTTQEKP